MLLRFYALHWGAWSNLSIYAANWRLWVQGTLYIFGISIEIFHWDMAKYPSHRGVRLTLVCLIKVFLREINLSSAGTHKSAHLRGFTVCNFLGPTCTSNFLKVLWLWLLMIVKIVKISSDLHLVHRKGLTRFEIIVITFIKSHYTVVSASFSMRLRCFVSMTWLEYQVTGDI